jgi:S1-C subfamily serine protease/tetratricopeptide (TPR) repeat protein
MKFDRAPRQLVTLKTIVFLILLQAIPAYAQQKTSGDGDWAEVVRKTMPAVVSIDILNSDGVKLASGTGFIVQSDGVIVTNHHVVRAGTRLSVVTHAGEKYEVKGVISYDVVKDFAIIRIPAVELPTLRLGNSNNLEVGENVLAIGDSLGLTGTASTGIVSAKNREAYGSTWLQFTAPVSHGNSGGPLLNRAGEVVGVVQGAFAGNDEGQNLNKAVPINFVRGSLQLGTSINYSITQVAKEWSEIEDARQKAFIKENFSPYKDPDGIFQVVSLSAWKAQREVKPLGNGNTLVQTIFAPPNAAMAKLGGYLSEGMAVDVVLPPKGATFAPNVITDLLNQYAESVLRENKGFELTSTGMINLNDMTAKIFRFKGRGPGLPEAEQDIYYLFGNEKAIVQLVVVQPASQLSLLEMSNEICAKNFELNLVLAGPSTPTNASPGLPQGVSGKVIENSYKSGLYDDVIRLAPAYLQTNPNSTEANAYLGLALLAKRDVDNAVVYLEKAISLGQQISLPVLRLREPLLGHALENATVTISANGVVVTSGNSNFTGSFSSLSNSSLANYNNQCYVASLRGNFIETSGKSEKTKQGNKTFNMFPPNSGLRPTQQGNLVINYAVCDTQSLNTTAIITLIARLAARMP